MYPGLPRRLVEHRALHAEAATLEDLAWGIIGRGFAVVAVAGVAMVFLNVRTVRAYD